MLSTQTDIKNDVIVKLGISTTLAYYTDDILNDWICQAHRWATAYKKFPFTEGRVSTTYVSGTEEWNFEGYKSDSFRILQVGGKRLEKIDFESYQIYREEETAGTDRVFTDRVRTVFINPNIDLAGTLTAWGQYTPNDPDMTGTAANTVFSNGDEEGNEAIVEKVLSFAKIREQKLDDAEYHNKRAKDILENMEGIIDDEQFNYKTKDRGMWKRIDVIGGDYYNDLIKRDQF
ncbi:MAG: hypothetical protein KKC03_13100 [Bacteroidetes bacterium]|nr:hypothetical protein [Bacteroidota bacterium]